MTALAPLPIPNTSAGTPRQTGVEIEFAGLDEKAAATLIQSQFGGRIKDAQDHSFVVSDTELGDFTVELDTALRKSKGGYLLDKGLDLARGLVPVEIVAPPLDMSGLARLNGFVETLQKTGALGSGSGILRGFGVHLNPEVVSCDDAHTLNTITAYALLDPYLRTLDGIDATRAAMPFIRHWPNGFVTAMANSDPQSLADVMRLARNHLSTRNHGLDLFPLFKHAEPDLFAELFEEDDLTSSRPTFHFRLPDCRIDEPEWSLADPWNMWRLVETVATQPQVMAQLKSSWKLHDEAFWSTRGNWAEQVGSVLSDTTQTEGAL